MRKWTLLWKNWPKSSAWAFRYLLVLWGIGISQNTAAQFVQKHVIDATRQQVVSRGDVKITAVAIIDEAAAKPHRTILIGDTKYELDLDIHAPRPTYFLSLPEPASTFSIPDAFGDIDVYTIHSGPPPHLAFSRTSTDCTEVNAVPQSEWRAGLPEPTATPTVHTVSHHIVHHSAGSNTNTNYVQVVRDIYLLHTEINGWDDIGYNFVIAQDGTLFEGRDPGTNATPYEVRGAHFCGKNTGTFGVALMGNYETAQPSRATRETLVNLLTFSLSELEIHPLSSSNHRGVNLDAISGHRDGCATLCPGANVYQILPEIRNEVLESISDCTETLALSFTSTQETLVGEEVAFENTSTGYDSYWWKFQGGSPIVSEEASPSVTYYSSGLYDVTLYGQAGNITDSLVATEFIYVEEQKPEPLVFPNLINVGDRFNIAFSEDLLQVSLFEITGKEVARYRPDGNGTFQAPSRSGFYTIMIETANKTFTQKLIIR